jgi:SAM-dependent methyltransferase
MIHYCAKNDIPCDNIIQAAEASMVTYEYQNLKDVHQPIWFEEYKDIMRTESEKDDPKYGQLVSANRKCEDRADMIYKNIEPWMTEETTWLDIGCNVGWFVFEFRNYFNIFGVDFDKEKIAFAKMMAEGNGVSVMHFSHMDINVDTVLDMPKYDVISVMSMLHLKLVADKDASAFWELFGAIAYKATKAMFFEFPPHSYKLLGLADGKEFMGKVKEIGEFDSVEEIGHTDAGRPMLKCLK